MTTEYVVLRAGVKSVLVLADSYDEDELAPQDYFVGSPKDAKEAGRIQVLGDEDQLDVTYVSD